MLKKRIINQKTLFESNTNSVLYLYITVMSMVLFARNVMDLSIPVGVCLVITAGVVLVSSPEQIVAIAATFVPFSAGFQYRYALLVCMLALLFKSKLALRKNKTILIVLLLMCWELLHCFYEPFSLVKLLQDFSALLLVAVVASSNLRINSKLVFRGISLATVIVCFIIMCSQVVKSGFDFTVFFENDGIFRFGNTDESVAYSLNFDPNYLGFVCNLCISCIFIMRSRSESTYFDLALIIPLSLFGLMTISRTFFVCLAFVVLFFLFSLSGSRTRKTLNVVSVIIIIGAIAIVVKESMPSVLEGFGRRFSEADITNGRDDLLVFYNEHIFSSWGYLIFGIGSQNYLEKIHSIYGQYSVSYACHNGIQEVLVIWGIIGVLLAVLLLFALIFDSKEGVIQHKAMSFLPLLLVMLSTLVLQFFSSGIIMLSLLVVYIALCE